MAEQVKLKVIRCFGLGGGTFAAPGDPIELPIAEAMLKIEQGKVEHADDPDIESKDEAKKDNTKKDKHGKK